MSQQNNEELCKTRKSTNRPWHKMQHFKYCEKNEFYNKQYKATKKISGSRIKTTSYRIQNIFLITQNFNMKSKSLNKEHMNKYFYNFVMNRVF